jgi:hypothetical protein
MILHTKESIVNKLSHMKRGERIVYHHGYLGVDRFNTANFGAPERKRIGEVANEMYQAYLLGKVHLFQRRTLNGCEYIAQRR